MQADMVTFSSLGQMKSNEFEWRHRNFFRFRKCWRAPYILDIWKSLNAKIMFWSFRWFFVSSWHCQLKQIKVLTIKWESLFQSRIVKTWKCFSTTWMLKLSCCHIVSLSILKCRLTLISIGRWIYLIKIWTFIKPSSPFVQVTFEFNF